MPRLHRLAVPLTLAATAFLAAPSPASASPRTTCPTVQVAQRYAAGALDAGAYAVSPLADSGQPCRGAETVIQSYLYDPPSFRYWHVRRLRAGGLRFTSPSGASFTASPTSRLVRAARAVPASTPPTASIAATQTCPYFTVVHNDSAVGFPAGTYHRLNFSPNNAGLHCSPPMPDSYDLMRDYLLDGSVHGYGVGPLTGSLAKEPGCRFLKTGTTTTGFDVWCDGKGSSRGPCVKARPVPANCGGHH